VRTLLVLSLLALSLPRARCGRSASSRPTLDAHHRDVARPNAVAPLEALPAIAPDPTPATAAPDPAHTRSIIAGGGSIPSLNQVSLAQDVALARSALAAPSLVMYASGQGSLAQVEVDSPEPDPFAARIAALLDERSGRDCRHVPAPVHAHMPSTADNVVRALDQALASSSSPLALYVAAHGSGGENPVDSVVGLWEDSELTVPALAQSLDRDPHVERPVRVVITSCFGGGFAEIAFRDADASHGPALTNHCGVFAALWDRESAGCDPNPDRRAQAGFGLHFLHALRGEDREGHPLDRASLDYDHDGTISLLDAHTRARIEGRSIDVSNTTSERWLRQQVSERVRIGVVATDPLVIEEDAVIDGLSRALDIEPTVAAALALVSQIDDELRAIRTQLEPIDARDDLLRRTQAAMVLARFPVLDDPWHRDFSAQLSAARSVIPAMLDAHPTTLERANLAARRDALSAQADPLEVRAAMAQRLWRAHENRVLAARLRQRGGRALAVFERLRACERTAP
jgi:hypothetical protein